MAIGQLTHLASTATLSTNSSASGTIPNDGSVAVGDVLLAACVMPSGSRTFSISGGGAGGWNSLGTASQSGHMSQVWWRIADASDLGATITVTPSTGNIRQVLLLGKVSGAAPLSPITSTSNTSAAATTKTTPSLGSVLANSREISVVWDTRGASTPQTASWTAPSGETRRAEAFTTSGSGACSGSWGDSNATVSGTIGSRVWTADQSALGSAWTIAVAQGDQAAAAGFIASTAVLYAPSASPGAATLAPNPITSSATTYAPAVAPGPVTAAPDPVGAATTLYSPSIAAGDATLAPAGIASTVLVHTPGVAPGAVTATAARLESTLVMHAPALTPGPATLTPGRAESTAAVFEPATEPGPVSLLPQALGPTSAVLAPFVAIESRFNAISAGVPHSLWRAGTPRT